MPVGWQEYHWVRNVWWLDFAAVAGGGIVVGMFGVRDVSFSDAVLCWLLVVFLGWLVG